MRSEGTAALQDRSCPHFEGIRDKIPKRVPGVAQSKTMATFSGEAWYIAVPEGWRAIDEPECATFVGPEEVGVLQISSAFKESSVLEDDLCEFASHYLIAGANPKATEAGDFVGFELSFTEEQQFWRHWYLRNCNQILFVTYNCELSSRGIDDEPVQEALASLVATDRDGV